MSDLKELRSNLVKDELYRNVQYKLSLKGLNCTEKEAYLFTGKEINFCATTDFAFTFFQSYPETEVLYKDKSMCILYGTPADGIEYIYIRSNWYGRVKNSHFKLGGISRNFAQFFYGYVAVPDILPMDKESLAKIAGSLVKEANTNKANLTTTFESFSEYVQYCQKAYGGSPTYEVIKQGGYDHAPVITIEITSPDGTFIAKGINKKNAANDWAKQRNR